MLRYELTPNNAGFILWGDSEALNELHELIHYIVDESPLIKVKDGFMLSLAYDIRKAREGNRRVEQHQYDQHVKWFTEFGHLNRGDMLTSEQHRCHNEKKKFQRRV